MSRNQDDTPEVTAQEKEATDRELPEEFIQLLGKLIARRWLRQAQNQSKTTTTKEKQSDG